MSSTLPDVQPATDLRLAIRRGEWISMADAAALLRYAIKPATLARMTDVRWVKSPARPLIAVRLNGRLYTTPDSVRSWIADLTDVGWPENTGYGLEPSELRRLDQLLPAFGRDVSRWTARRWAIEGIQIGGGVIRIPHARIGKFILSTAHAIDVFRLRRDELMAVEANRAEARGLRPHGTALARCLGSVAQSVAHGDASVLQTTHRRGAGSSPATAIGRAAGSAAADRVAIVEPTYGPS